MGDRVAVMDAGVLQQVATPREMYDRPANLFVAGFLGSPAMNVLDLPVVDGGVQFGDSVLPVPRDVLDRAAAPTVVVGIRPENLRLADHGLAATVSVVEETGADAYLYAHTGSLTESIVARTDWHHPPQKGDDVHLAAIDPALVHVFDTATGARL